MSLFLFFLFRALFPCDDSMVCIIDDREDIWDCAPNLVTVKPYRFFTGTGDINAPPGSDQAFTHPPAIPLHESASEVELKDSPDGKTNDGADNERKNIGASNTTNSSNVSENNSSVSEKYEMDMNSEKDKEDCEVDQNATTVSKEEICDAKEGKNGYTVTDKLEEEKVDCDEMKDVKGQNSEKENEEANCGLSKKSPEDVVDGNQVEDHDDYLLYLEEILGRIHKSFYEVVAWNKQADENGNDPTTRVAPDLRNIVPELRRNVLKGTKIVFTGVIPTNIRPEESQAWKIATQFGASVSKDLLTQKNTADRSQRTTHVVAARPGTEKACQALRLPSVRLVNPNWLWTCAERWEWVDERLFPVEDYHEYKTRSNGTPTASRRGTPKRQPGDEVNVKNNNNDSQCDDVDVGHMTDDKLMIVLNPFASFSSGEMEAMDKEVEDLMKSSDEEDDEDDEKEQILGSVSSSSSSTENGDSQPKADIGEDVPDGSTMVDALKANEMNFSTIKQNRHEDEGSPSKRRKLDFFRDDDDDEDDEEGDFSSDEGSSGSNSGEDDGNMAALLEAELFS